MHHTHAASLIWKACVDKDKDNVCVGKDKDTVDKEKDNVRVD